MANRKIDRLEPWDQGLACALLEERRMWLNDAVNTCIQSSPTRGDAVERLAGWMECYLAGAIDDLWDSTPKHIILATAGFWELDPNLNLWKVSDAVLEDYWPEGTPKPTGYPSGKAARSDNRKPKAPAKKPANRKPRATSGRR